MKIILTIAFLLGAIACTDPLDCPPQIQWNAEMQRCQNLDGSGKIVPTECCERMWKEGTAPTP